MFIENCKYAILRVTLVGILVAGIFGVQPAQAETINFGWVEGGGGINPDHGEALAADDSGNVFATGVVNNGSGTWDVFTHKRDSNGNLAWSNIIAGPSYKSSRGITLDGDGNVYITGYFEGTVEFDPGNAAGNRTSAGTEDAFVIKYDGNGNFVWVKSVGGTSADGGSQVALDANGNVYLIGYFADTVDFDPGAGVSNLTSAGSLDVFISKFDNNGNFIWAKSMGGTSEEEVYDIAIDLSGNMYVTGYFSETADFDPGMGTRTLTSIGDHDIFISKLDNNGNLVWAQSMGGRWFDSALDMALDGNGNIWLVGYFEDAIFAGTSNLIGAGGFDIFISKLDGNGNFIWAKGMGGASYDLALGIALDDYGNAYITGEFSGTADFDPGTGTSNLTSAGARDIFISKLDSNGNLIWAKKLGGSSDDGGDGIAIKGSGNLYLTGYYSNTVDFDPGTGTSNLTSVGSTDFFISKLTFTPQLYYVKWNASGANNGTSWADAYTDLQSALSVASGGDEIWVAAGTYMPTASTDRAISFTLRNGVAIYGGFAGTEASRDQRDPVAHVTILSGDLNGDDQDYTGLFLDQPTRAENVFHVVSGNGLGKTAVLDGFTIKGGNANLDFGADTARGGGMWNGNGSPTLTNIIFTDNISLELGGGMVNYDQSQPVLTNVLFTRNYSEGGGGLANIYSSPTLLNVRFDANAASYTGGGMVNVSNSKPVLEHVTFDGNSAWTYGGGMASWESAPRVSNSGFHANVAFGREHPVSSYAHIPPFGGGMYNAADYDSHAVIVNSTFQNNGAGDESHQIGGSAVGNRFSNPTLINVTISENVDGIMNYGSEPVIRNSIIWGTGSFIAITDNSYEGGSTVSDSVIQNGFPEGTNIITADPKLGIPLDDGDSTQPIPLLPGSSAIDHANASYCPAIDQRYIARPQGSGCDIGAYEYAEGPIATATPTTTPTPTQTPTSTFTPTPTQTATQTATATSTPTPSVTQTPTATPVINHDRDTTGVFRPSNGLLYLKNANMTGFADIAINYGVAGDYPVVGDWDGNGDATIGVYRNGKFYLRNSNSIGYADMVFAFGTPGDQPIAGDWNGDGVDTIGVYRPSIGQFLLRNSNTAGAAEMSFYLGNVGDVGIAGDWDGDGKDTTGVFRPVNGIIFLKNTNETGFADIALNYGIPGDKPVTGDWDNDGIDTIGVYRNGQFMLRNSNTIGFADIVFVLGNPGDMPIAGNWDGIP